MSSACRHVNTILLLLGHVFGSWPDASSGVVFGHHYWTIIPLDKISHSQRLKEFYQNIIIIIKLSSLPGKGVICLKRKGVYIIKAEVIVFGYFLCENFLSLRTFAASETARSPPLTLVLGKYMELYNFNL